MKNQTLSALLWANKKCRYTSRIYENSLKAGINLCVVESLYELLKHSVTGEFQILICDANNMLCDEQVLDIFSAEPYHIPYLLIICDTDNMFQSDASKGIYVCPYEDVSYEISKIVNSITLNNFSSADYNPNSIFRQEIRKYLLDVGLITKYLGFDYLIEITQIMLDNHISAKSLNSNVYPLVASKFHTTSTAVERNIRHILNSCWTTSNKLQTAFSGYYNDEKPPSNRLFICTITNFLKEKLNERYNVSL